MVYVLLYILKENNKKKFNRNVSQSSNKDLISFDFYFLHTLFTVLIVY